MIRSWTFIDEEGTFELPDPHHSNYLYFPLVNEAGMMSVVTPLLQGDSKTGQHSFLGIPVSVEDLHNSRSGRNFWLTIRRDSTFPGDDPHADDPGQAGSPVDDPHADDPGQAGSPAEAAGPGLGCAASQGSCTRIWSAVGVSPQQMAERFTGPGEENVSLRAGLLWHEIARENRDLGLKSEVTSFIPFSDDRVELTRVRISNTSDRSIRFTPTAAFPIYGRSADNLRDHRHVTSLLHRIACLEYGVLVRPTLSFDERGHLPNTLTYAVLGSDGSGAAPAGFFPVVEDFIGEGGSLEWPEAVVCPLEPAAAAGEAYAGLEALGGLRFADCELEAGESCSFILAAAVLHEGESPGRLIDAYGTDGKFDAWLGQTCAYWRARPGNLSVHTGDQTFDRWMKWVSVQPTLRRLFGNSFLPYHDYGRGGRGWRDLWQDILGLLILETGSVDEMLFENFAGVRMDGSNATIIGSSSGEFRADRNNIPRVWMDHGAWPMLTIRFYLDQTGDLAFLLREQVYFKDHLIRRAQAVDQSWDQAQGTRQRTTSGLYHGTVLEHLLVQHLCAAHNVGEHGIIRLEGADWNDGLDMAPDRGESVAFTALYASNLRQLAELVQALERTGVETVELARELFALLENSQDGDKTSPAARQAVLQSYFAAVSHTVSGEKRSISLQDLAGILVALADRMDAHIREQEWIADGEAGWFNGYYDNLGRRLEGCFPDGVRMTLTGQVFPLMGTAADERQAEQVLQSMQRWLWDPECGGLRLNTDFGEGVEHMGRSFGFAYGHKENGAVFSHMAVMAAYALYGRGYARWGWKVLDQLYRQSVHFEDSRMLPGIPEYFTPRGRGVYPYLTGSASWYIFTLLTQSFGIRGDLGDLCIHPALTAEQFDEQGTASVETMFAGLRLRVEFHNPRKLDYPQYVIRAAHLDGERIGIAPAARSFVIERDSLNDLDKKKLHIVRVDLAGKDAGS